MILSPKLLLSSAFALFVAVWPTWASTASYVVLDWCSLTRISEDGKSRHTITDAACGYRQGIDQPGSAAATGSYGLTLDGHGNYIVAAVSSLLKVTPSGEVSIIARAPEGSGWLAVAFDSRGNFIVADNRRHAIWRISGDGQTVKKVANYPAPETGHWEGVSIVVESSGDYLVIEENVGLALVRITPTGLVTPIPLHGERLAIPGQMIADGEGKYLVTSAREKSILRVTPAGDVTTFARVNAAAQTCMALTRSAETGDVVVACDSGSSLLRINPQGAAGIIGLDLQLSHPTAIISEAAK